MASEFRRMMMLRGSPTDWAANNIVPLAGEVCVEFNPGRIRMKVGDGANVYSALPYTGEQDDIARAANSVNSGAITSLTSRMVTAETATALIPGIQGDISSIQTGLAGKQQAFPIGGSPGDLIQWNGSAWVPITVGAIGGSVAQFDQITGRWQAVPKGAPGYVLTTSPSGVPSWLPNSAVTVRTITLAGSGGDVWTAFNGATPTVQAGELVIVTYDNTAYVYTGPPGANINNSNSSQFTQLGSATAFATLGDFTTPPGGATDRAVSPNVLNIWVPTLVFDCGTY
jgi:hypothetical protein